MKTTLLLVVSMGAVFPAHADAYRCLDAGGKTVYQEKPCETTNLKAVGKVAKPVGEPSQQAIEKSQAEVNAFNKRYSERKKAEQEAEKKEAEQIEAQQKANPPNGNGYGGQ